MRALFLCILFAVLPAHADLYRWVDPQSGSVKISSLPPPWYGDAAQEARSPKVEVFITRPKPPAAAVAEKPVPPKAPPKAVPST